MERLRSLRVIFSTVKRSSLHFATLGSVALCFTLIGILIASNLDMSPQPLAQVPTNIAQTGLYPVVDRFGENESPFVSVVDRVADAVVNISAKSRQTNAPWWHRNRGIATSLGSGFFFRKDGYILTNNHVVKDAIEMTVRTASGYEYEAQLVGADPQTDLAVIKVKPEEEITIIPFGESEEIKVGDWAIAIGNPFPQQGLDRTVTVGVVSAKGRSSLNFGGQTPLYQNYIQTDAAINPGNSGGPLLSLRGEVIGINAAITSPTGTSVGIGFAVPINLARAIVPDLIATGKASRGWLGVRLSDISERDAKQQGLSAVKGIKIDSVFIGSPAERAGIKRGDIVVSFNDHDIANSNQFSVLVSTVHHGNIVPVEIVRDGEHIFLQTMVGDREAALANFEQEPDPLAEDRSEVWMGMELINYTVEIADAIGADHVDGLYVTRVYPFSPAERASITEGSIIMKIDNNSVENLGALNNVTSKLKRTDKRIAIIVQEPDGAIARKVIRQ